MKYIREFTRHNRESRPRKGAWIEIGICHKSGGGPSSPPQGGVD